MRIADALAGVTSLGLDTAPIIYFVEDNPTYVAACREVFRRISAGQLVGYTSLLTLTDALVHPRRNADTSLEAEYGALLLETAGIVSLPLDVVPPAERPICAPATASERRMRFRLPPPLSRIVRHSSPTTFDSAA